MGVACGRYGGEQECIFDNKNMSDGRFTALQVNQHTHTHTQYDREECYTSIPRNTLKKLYGRDQKLYVNYQMFVDFK